MYQVSNEFHTQSVKRGARRELLLRFEDGTFLTGEDVTGIEVTYPLNEDTELTVGRCVAAEMKTTVLNYHGLLSGFAFGKCRASLGVVTGVDEWSMPTGAKVAAVYGYGTDDAITFAASASAPYLTVNGSAANVQPGFSPDCLVVMGNKLYAGSEGGAVWGASIGADGTLTALGGSFTWGELAELDWSDVAEYTWGELSSGALSAFLAHKLQGWRGRGLTFTEGRGYAFSAAGAEVYEYVPLGTFIIDTPEQRRVTTIVCEARDEMQRFEVDCDDWWAGIAWPKTRLELLQSLCGEVGVTLDTTTFPGSGISLAAAPMAGNGLTAKEVLGWIAESAGSYARMSRDGKLELAWFAAAGVTLTQLQYYSDAPAEYETPPITALHVLAMESDVGVMVPEGATGNEYQVVDDPLLYGATEAEIRQRAQPLYDRLSGFPAYTPNSVDALCDWSITPGDIIQVAGRDGTTRALPIFRMTLSWSGGGARATYECTGGRGRKPTQQSKRRELALYRAYNKLAVDIEGIHSEIGDVAGNVASLEVTASELRVQIAGKIDGEDAQTMIDQTVDKLELSVQSGGGGTTFTLTKDGATLSGQTVDLQVEAANISGTLTANQINANGMDISYANIGTLQVGASNIPQLYANSIVGGAGATGGYVASKVISDTSHPLSDLNVTDVTANEIQCGTTMRLGGGSSYVVIGGTKVSYYGSTTVEATWADILSGSAGGAVAVFG